MTSVEQEHESLRRLQRQAAEAGPGRRGRRRDTSFADRQAIARQIEEAGAAAPDYLTVETEWIERSAKLFEAGDYPDKGVSVSLEDLDALALGFDLPVPVLIEHSESPLQLGYLTDVQPHGRELFGTVALTKEANALVERSGAKRLSLGLSPDLRSIREVSLVRNPRVESAQLFFGEFRAPKREPNLEDGRLVDQWLREGRITPAQSEFARSLLAVGDTIEFEGSRKPLRQLVIAMFERQPPLALFSEIAPAARPDATENLLLPEEADFYRRHFPEVQLAEIAARR